MEKPANENNPPTKGQGHVAGKDSTGSKGTGPKGKTVMKGKDDKGKGKDIKGKGQDIKGKGKDIKGKGKDIKGKGKDLKGKGKDVEGKGNVKGKDKGHLGGDASSGQKGKGVSTVDSGKGSSTAAKGGASKTEAKGPGEQAEVEATPPAIVKPGKTDKAKSVKNEAEAGELPGTKVPAVEGKGSGKTGKTKEPEVQGKDDKDTKRKDQQGNGKRTSPVKRPEGHVGTNETQRPGKFARRNSGDVKTPSKEGTTNKALEGMSNS